MPSKPWAKWPQVLLSLLLIVSLVHADVRHLEKNYLPPESQPSEQQSRQPLADEVPPPPPHPEQMQANDGAYYPMAGLMLPPGYAIPTGGNVAPPPMSPPNFPLPIYPPFFGFGGGGPEVPPGYPNEAQFPGGSFPVGAQGTQFGQFGGQFPIEAQGQFPVGPQGGNFAGQGSPFPAGPQGTPFPVGSFPPGPQAGNFAAAAQSSSFPAGPQGGPFPAGPQGSPFPAGPQGGPFPAGPQGGPFLTGPQGSPFPVGPQGGNFEGAPFSAGPQSNPFPTGAQGTFPAGPQLPQFPGGPQGGQFGGAFPFPPDYLITQGLPSAGIQLPFQQNGGFGTPPGFGGPQPSYPYQQLVNVGQPFSPSFGIPGQNYQPQQFADEPQSDTDSQSKPKSSPTTAKTTTAPKSQNRDTVYASNGGYVYQRAK